MWLLLLREILDNMCIATACEPCGDVINFEINLLFLIKPFFLHEQKVKTKIKGIRKIAPWKVAH